MLDLGGEGKPDVVKEWERKNNNMSVMTNLSDLCKGDGIDMLRRKGKISRERDTKDSTSSASDKLHGDFSDDGESSSSSDSSETSSSPSEGAGADEHHATEGG